MFDWTKHLDSIGADVGRLQALAQKAIERESDPGLRQHMKQLNDLMGQAFDKIKETLPVAEGKLNQDVADLQQAQEDMAKDIAAAEQQLDEAAQQAAAAAPLPAAIPFDPRLGLQLRDELLKRFAPTQAAPRQASAGEVASMSSGEFESTEELPRPAPPKPGQQPKSPPPKRNEGDWSLDG